MIVRILGQAEIQVSVCPLVVGTTGNKQAQGEHATEPPDASRHPENRTDIAYRLMQLEQARCLIDDRLSIFRRLQACRLS